jgi:hypothetical protein
MSARPLIAAYQKGPEGDVAASAATDAPASDSRAFSNFSDARFLPVSSKREFLVCAQVSRSRRQLFEVIADFRLAFDDVAS